MIAQTSAISLLASACDPTSPQYDAVKCRQGKLETSTKGNKLILFLQDTWRLPKFKRLRLIPGVALPHPRHPLPYDIAASFVVVGLTGAGIPFGAEDGSLKLSARIGQRSSLAIGYRTVEGGADVDEVYNFAWLHYAVISFTHEIW